MFDYGELRLLVLALIADQPRHGYELIKGIEERSGGAYSPSPGVIYPTLAWLDDRGYAQVEADEGGRKRYRITAEGEAFLAANKAAAEALLARGGPAGEGNEGGGFARGGRWAGVPVGIVRGMENLKLALRLRIRGGTLDEAAAERIAAALDEAARAIEKA
jgi:DNA-binding PadR family transcriptional regulator